MTSISEQELSRCYRYNEEEYGGWGYGGKYNNKMSDYEFNCEWQLQGVEFYRPDGYTEGKDIGWCLSNGFFMIKPGLWSGPWYFENFPEARRENSSQHGDKDPFSRLFGDYPSYNSSSSFWSSKDNDWDNISNQSSSSKDNDWDSSSNHKPPEIYDDNDSLFRDESYEEEGILSPLAECVIPKSISFNQQEPMESLLSAGERWHQEYICSHSNYKISQDIVEGVNVPTSISVTQQETLSQDIGEGVTKKKRKRESLNDNNTNKKNKSRRKKRKRKKAKNTSTTTGKGFPKISREGHSYYFETDLFDISNGNRSEWWTCSFTCPNTKKLIPCCDGITFTLLKGPSFSRLEPKQRNDKYYYKKKRDAKQACKLAVHIENIKTQQPTQYDTKMSSSSASKSSHAEQAQRVIMRTKTKQELSQEQRYAAGEQQKQIITEGEREWKKFLNNKEELKKRYHDCLDYQQKQDMKEKYGFVVDLSRKKKKKKVKNILDITAADSYHFEKDFFVDPRNGNRHFEWWTCSFTCPTTKKSIPCCYSSRFEAIQHSGKYYYKKKKQAKQACKLAVDKANIKTQQATQFDTKMSSSSTSKSSHEQTQRVVRVGTKAKEKSIRKQLRDKYWAQQYAAKRKEEHQQNQEMKEKNGLIVDLLLCTERNTARERQMQQPTMTDGEREWKKFSSRKKKAIRS